MRSNAEPRRIELQRKDAHTTIPGVLLYEGHCHTHILLLICLMLLSSACTVDSVVLTCCCLCFSLLQQLHLFSHQELAMLLWALARMEQRPEPSWLASYLEASKQQLPSMSLLSIATILAGLQTLDFLPPSAWMSAACATASRCLSQEESLSLLRKERLSARVQAAVAWYHAHLTVYTEQSSDAELTAAGGDDSGTAVDNSSSSSTGSSNGSMSVTAPTDVAAMTCGCKDSSSGSSSSGSSSTYQGYGLLSAAANGHADTAGSHLRSHARFSNGKGTGSQFACTDMSAFSLLSESSADADCMGLTQLSSAMCARVA